MFHYEEQVGYTKGTREYSGVSFGTEKVELTDVCVIEAEAGTTGLCGGDTGHGCRTFIGIRDLGGCDIEVTPIVDEFGHCGGFELRSGGDAELHCIIDALDYISETLKTHRDIAIGKDQAKAKEYDFPDSVM